MACKNVLTLVFVVLCRVRNRIWRSVYGNEHEGGILQVCLRLFVEGWEDEDHDRVATSSLV